MNAVVEHALELVSKGNRVIGVSDNFTFGQLLYLHHLPTEVSDVRGYLDA